VGPEEDSTLHQRGGELQEIWDADLPLLYFPLLFQPGELGCQLQVLYQDGATSHNFIPSFMYIP